MKLDIAKVTVGSLSTTIQKSKVQTLLVSKQRYWDVYFKRDWRNKFHQYGFACLASFWNLAIQNHFLYAHWLIRRIVGQNFSVLVLVRSVSVIYLCF